MTEEGSKFSVLGVIIDERTGRIVLTKKKDVDLWRLPGGPIPFEKLHLLSSNQKDCEAGAMLKNILKDWTGLIAPKLKLILVRERQGVGEVYAYAGLADFKRLKKNERIRSFSSDEVLRLNMPMVHRLAFREVLEEISE